MAQSLAHIAAARDDDASSAPRHSRATAGFSERLDLVVLSGLVATLAWCPFWFGSNDLLAWSVNALLTGGLLVFFELSLLLTGRPHPVGIRAIAAPLGLFASLVCWISLQMASSTPSVWHHPLWAMASDALDTPIRGSVSVNGDLTFVALLRLLTASGVFWLALQLCRETRRANILLYAISAIGFAYALFGLLAFAIAPGTVLWTGGGPARFVTSTFLNQNSFAGYVGIGFLATGWLIFRLYRQELDLTSGSLGFRIAQLIEVTGSYGAILLTAGFVLVTALLLTGSRGGIIATGIGLVASVILSLRSKSGVFRNRRLLLGLMIALVAIIFMVFGDVFLGRISQDGVTEQGRITIYRTVVLSILMAPVFGYGYGTFVDIFPMFRDASVNLLGTWSQAHNTYLEAFQGLGPVFAIVMIVGIALLVRACIQGAMVRHAHTTFALLAAGAAILVGGHALVDFSVQMQAVALTLAAVLGLGVAQSHSSRVSLGD